MTHLDIHSSPLHLIPLTHYVIDLQRLHYTARIQIHSSKQNQFIRDGQQPFLFMLGSNLHTNALMSWTASCLFASRMQIMMGGPKIGQIQYQQLQGAWPCYFCLEVPMSAHHMPQTASLINLWAGIPPRKLLSTMCQNPVVVFVHPATFIIEPGFALSFIEPGFALSLICMQQSLILRDKGSSPAAYVLLLLSSKIIKWKDLWISSNGSEVWSQAWIRTDEISCL